MKTTGSTIAWKTIHAFCGVSRRQGKTYVVVMSLPATNCVKNLRPFRARASVTPRNERQPRRCHQKSADPLNAGTKVIDVEAIAPRELFESQGIDPAAAPELAQRTFELWRDRKFTDIRRLLS